MIYECINEFIDSELNRLCEDNLNGTKIEKDSW